MLLDVILNPNLMYRYLYYQKKEKSVLMVVALVVKSPLKEKFKFKCVDISLIS